MYCWMKSHFQYLFLGLLTWVVCNVNAQEPAYIRVGVDELGGIDLYSIAHDTKGNLWLTGEHGLVKYDGYDFSFITSSELKDASLFGLVKDGAGRLYCNNLNGQVFRIEDDSLKLFYTMPDTLLNNWIEFNFDFHDNLLIRGTKIFVVDTMGKPTFPPAVKGRAGFFTFNRVNDTTIWITGDNSGILVLHPDTFYDIKYTKLKAKQNYSVDSNFLFCRSDYKVFYWEGQGFKELKLQLNGQEAITNGGRLIRSKGILLFASPTGGAYLFRRDGTPMFGGNRLFAPFHISGVSEDKDGNIWLITIRNGLLYIPNLDVQVYHQVGDVLGTQFTKVQFGQSEHEFIIGAEGGDIYVLDTAGIEHHIYKNDRQNIDVLIYNRNEDIVLTRDLNKLTAIESRSRKVSQLSDQTFVHTIKDVIPIGLGEYVVSGSVGVGYIGRDTSWRSTEPARTINIHYDTSMRQIWTASIQGMFILDLKGNVKRLDSFPNVPTDVTGDGMGNVWASTSNGGVVHIQNGKIIKTLTTKDGLLDNLVVKLIWNDGRLFIATSKGLQMMKGNGDIEDITPVQGGKRNFITDFDVRKDRVAYLSGKDMLSYSITDLLNQKHSKPRLYWESILVNGIAQDYTTSNTYGYNKNRFQFKFSTPVRAHTNDIEYRYRLLGLDVSWTRVNYQNNQISFEALPYGEYQFEVQALSRSGIYSEPIYYRFTINRPFWLEVWFWGIAVGVLLLSVYLTYRFNLNRIQRKEQLKGELAHSKLTALKSQMNPHFIFNALNAIQDLILKQEVEQSYNYIAKFSSLVRRTLNYSDQEFISFEDEMKLINTYLELESLRFKEGFSYTIDKNGVQDILIPPMLLQPLIENGVKHGLLHKKGNKSLKVSFRLEEVLICEIEDNGIGRAAAESINSKRKKYQSFGNKAVKKRFEIFYEMFPDQVGLIYEDLYKDGIAVGTIARLRMPFKREY